MKIARPILSSVSALLVAACTPMTVDQCRSADWYRLGYRDGDVYGLQAQIDQYADQCANVAVDRNNYMAGWRDGYAEYRSRIEKTESP